MLMLKDIIDHHGARPIHRHGIFQRSPKEPESLSSSCEATRPHPVR